MQQKNQKATIALICGIVGLCVSVVGGLTFGVIGAALGLACSIVGLVMAIGAKKETGGTQGTGGFVCALLGVIFGGIFMIGCAACSCGGYGCYGCVGGTICVAKDVDNAGKALGAW